MTTRPILLLAAALLCWAAPAAGQTIKSLGYNTTNGNIVAATNVTFTNSVGFATNARAATRTNLGGTTVGNAVFTATNAQAAAAAVGLGVFSAVEFSTVFAASIGSPSFLSDGSLNEADLPISFSSGAEAGTRTNLGLGTFKTTLDSFSEMYSGSDLRVQAGDIILFYEAFSFGGTNAESYKSQSRIALGIPLAALTNTSNVTTMRALAGSTNTNQPFSGSIALTNTNTLVFSNGILLSQ
jgi:hypothetical protein